MIRDNDLLDEIRNEWKTVQSTWEMIAANISWSFSSGGLTSHTFRCVSYSLTLLFAFSVLEDVLQQLRDEGHFVCNRKNVGLLMSESRNNIPWVNYSLVDKARERRNDIAHRQQWIEIEECRSYLDGIETELRGWGIID